MSNKLKDNQLGLIYHLAHFGTLDYLSCLRFLDTEGTNDRTALSYAFRPLTKNNYLRKHEDGHVTILAKGRELYYWVKPLVTLGGGDSTIKRVNSISRTAMFMTKAGIISVSSPDETKHYCFIPSTCWRKIQKGILSTTRFTGILFAGDHRLAVYDIGDGSMDWQLRAERSLFKPDWGSSTHATGMLFICDDDKRIEAAQRIIRTTMWNRKQLIDKQYVRDRDKPVRYSRAPIKLATQYKHAYLTTPALLKDDVDEIAGEEGLITERRGNRNTCSGGKKNGDYVAEGYCHFINVTTDLLKYICFFSEVKSGIAVRERSSNPNQYVKYAISLPRCDFPILKMYPDVSNPEVITVYEYKLKYNAKSNRE
jgi:hypothetical protein